MREVPHEAGAHADPGRIPGGAGPGAGRGGLYPAADAGAGVSGYTAEGAAEFNALAAEGDGCLPAGLYIGWYNEGPLSWTLPYTVRDIVVYGADVLFHLQPQPLGTGAF